MKKILWWQNEMFYREATPFGRVIINIVAPFYYGWGLVRERISRIRR